MNRRVFFSLITVLLCSLTACNQPPAGKQTNENEVSKQTYTFAIKGADTLRLDKYEMERVTGDTLPKPVVLFAFGGGFKGGNRDNESYIPYFHFLAENGYVVVSTDYRTGLKGIDPAKMTNPMEFAAALQKAIAMAVEDFFDATGYITKNGEEWRINSQQIIACGSSAGAVTSLQAEYEICNRTPLTQRLPASFQYAGVISFAGAICSLGIPDWPELPCPIMLFHGDADRTVPFDKALLENMGLWGSNFIAKQLQVKQSPYYFYLAEDAGHEMAGLPMENNRYDILSFLDRFVIRREKVFINTVETIPGKPKAKKDFTLQDYVQNNL